MKTALVVTADANLRARLLRALGARSVFTEAGEEEALRTLRTTQVDLVIADIVPPVRRLTHFIAHTRQLSPVGVVVCLCPAEGLRAEDEEALEAADFLLRKPFTSQELARVIRQADEKHGLVLELSALRTQRPATPQTVGETLNGASEMAGPVLAPVVKEFARALSAGFDLPRALDLFLDAVSEALKPSRCALLLAEGDGAEFRIRAHRGLARSVANSVRLPADGGLALWLQAQARLIQVEEAQARAQDPQAREIARELAVLQAVVAVPLIAHGELIAILTLGQRITGLPYHHRETEILFNLATYLATAIHDIRLHHELRYQKVYIERILAHMSNGVITIDREHKVTILNRRAEEILGLPAAEVLDRDLRVLPSPLGDFLYETLTTGRTVQRVEIQLALRKLPLEVSTYPIAGDDPAPLGAVMVFEDLSAAKQLAAEKLRTEQLHLLSGVIGRVADEIKNPLVSINTFMELLGERYEDADFRHRFSTVVGRDVKRLGEIFEKLTALVREAEFNFEVVEMQAVVEDCLTAVGAKPGPDTVNGARILHLTDEASGKRVTVSVYREAGPLKVKADRAQLQKALAYVIWYLMGKSPGEEVKLSISLGRSSGVTESIQVLISSRTAVLKPDEFQQIFDPVKGLKESLIDVGPYVSQRIIEAQGGQLQARQARHEVSFLASLPVTLA
ncbi:MAG: GAF domain-containing protein [Candidatus Rokubacteria bacterium]|nr:GAF domain-containing protein [Candidatus Rokubacteria bacterium]